MKSRFLVARPLWVAEAASYALADGLAERYPAPPTALADAFLQSCSGLSA